ncbi:MAG: leucine-rich repeat domain-containing protein, partial [Treponema sp.]|nr:leucine-rich repeat domain-containing protein [Treponema sp.]
MTKETEPNYWKYHRLMLLKKYEGVENMKKKIVILVTVLMVLAVSIFAQTANSGDDFTIKQNAQGNITITGYTGSSTQVVIPETIEGIQVTEIASRAFAIGRPVAGISPNERMVSFYSRMNPEPEIIAINSIVIPNTVIIIGDQAFFGQSLMSVTLSTSLTTIGDSAFSGNQLTSVTIPNSVTRIGKKAFENNSLSSVTIP